MWLHGKLQLLRVRFLLHGLSKVCSLIYIVSLRNTLFSVVENESEGKQLVARISLSGIYLLFHAAGQGGAACGGLTALTRDPAWFWSVHWQNAFSEVPRVLCLQCLGLVLHLAFIPLLELQVPSLPSIPAPTNTAPLGSFPASLTLAVLY